MNTYTDTITEWYADAEKVTKTNLPNKGDTLIYPRYGGEGYSIETNPDEWTPSIVGNHERVRILARAPKPKPAWHSAKAVVASTDYCERQVWEWDFRGWNGSAGDAANTEDLRDVTPLVEAKVTDEMVERIREASRDGRIKGSYWDVDGYYRAILTAALGIEAE